MKQRLAYIALSTADAERLSAFFGDGLGLENRSISHPDGSFQLFSIGECYLCVVEQGHGFLNSTNRTGLDHIGLSVSENDLPTIAEYLNLHNPKQNARSVTKNFEQ